MSDSLNLEVSGEPADHEEKARVQLYIYDLSHGMGKLYAPLFGLNIEGVWHTAVVVHNKEIYFGSGIFVNDPGKTHLGAPDRVLDMGTTEVPWEVIEEYLDSLRHKYSASQYHLLNHNCNHFSDELLDFLTGKNVPEDIMNVAEQVAATPLGSMISGSLGDDGGASFVP